MAGQYFMSPFTPETPIGAGLQNIALALTGRRANARDPLYAQQGGMYDAHSEMYREQARKASVERQIAERMLRDQGADSQDELIAARSGVPVYTVRGYRDALAGRPVPGATLDDYSTMAPAISRAMLAVRPAYADKTINPVNIAQALDSLERTDMRGDVVNGTRKAADVARGFFATSGHAPYAGSETGSTDLLTGGQTLNDIGTARAGRERAHARDYNAQAGQRENETETGVKLGAPVVIDGGEAGPVYAPPRAALGQRPGLNPNSAAARPRGAAGDGSTSTVTDVKPKDIHPQDANLLLGGIDRAVGGKLSDQKLEGAILSRAQEYYATPGSPHYGKHEEAARAAVVDVMPGGSEQPFYRFGESGYRPKGEPNMAPGPINRSTSPTTTRKTVTKGGAPSAAPAQQPMARQPAGRPQGKSDQQLIAEANDAIRKGAPRETVMQRLQSWGVRVD